jgi:uncharacterized protein YndB with AHSA1/START domain
LHIIWRISMADSIERDLFLAASPTEVWRALTDVALLEQWLADEVILDLRPGGDACFRSGDVVRSGWVETVTPPGRAGEPSRPGRLAFWWADGDQPATRVELTLLPVHGGRTRIRVTERRPLEILDLVGIPLPGPGGASYGPALVAAAA